MSQALEYPQFQAFDADGAPLSGGLVYTYEAGTTTAKATYTDKTLATANANPVVLDSRGEAEIFLDGSYKIVLQTSVGVTIWTLDNVQGSGSSVPVITQLSEYADLASAVTSIGATESELWIDTDDIMTSNIASIPVTLKFKFLPGKTITTTGYNLTFAGNPEEHIMAAPQQQIFAGTGSVSWATPGVVYPEWWGIDGTADEVEINYAISAVPANSIVKFLGSSYTIAATITGASDVTLDFGDSQVTSGLADIDLVTFTSKNNFHIMGGRFDGVTTTSTAKGIFLDTCSEFTLKRVYGTQLDHFVYLDECTHFDVDDVFGEAVDGTNGNVLVLTDGCQYGNVNNIRSKDTKKNVIYLSSNNVDEECEDINISNVINYCDSGAASSNGFAIRGGQRISVNNVKIYDPSQYGFQLQLESTDTGRLCKDININNVSIYNAGHQAFLIIGNLLSGSHSDINVSNVTIDTNGDSDDAFQVQDADHIQLENINIKAADNRGLLVKTCDYVSLKNIFMDDVENYGIEIEDCTYVNMDNVIVKDASQSGDDTYQAFYFDGTTSVVRGNNLMAIGVAANKHNYGFYSNTNTSDIILRGTYDTGAQTAYYGTVADLIVIRELQGSVTWNPGSLADGAGETKSLTVTGAALGDFVMVSAPYDLEDLIATAYVQAADTVEIRLQNESTGTIDLASDTWRVRVLKY